MNKDEALRLALEALEPIPYKDDWTVAKETNKAIIAIKAALEAKDEPYAFEASMYSNDRMKVDPVTGNVSIGTPQQEAKDEPVAWIWEKEDGYTSIETHSLNDEDMKNVGVKSMKPLYAKPQFIGLSEDEIVLISADCAASHQHMDIHFARAIEAKLKEKNT
jgi:hypothetical protein